MKSDYLINTDFNLDGFDRKGTCTNKIKKGKIQTIRIDVRPDCKAPKRGDIVGIVPQTTWLPLYVKHIGMVSAYKRIRTKQGTDRKYEIYVIESNRYRPVIDWTNDTFFERDEDYGNKVGKIISVPGCNVWPLSQIGRYMYKKYVDAQKEWMELCDRAQTKLDEKDVNASKINCMVDKFHEKRNELISKTGKRVRCFNLSTYRYLKWDTVVKKRRARTRILRLKWNKHKSNPHTLRIYACYRVDEQAVINKVIRRLIGEEYILKENIKLYKIPDKK